MSDDWAHGYFTCCRLPWWALRGVGQHVFRCYCGTLHTIEA